MQTIFFSNKIDGDEETILNGALQKKNESGGEDMKGRKIYGKPISFIPQFIMFLFYN